MLEQLQQLLPGVRFEAGPTFCWSPKEQKISYVDRVITQPEGIWSLLHEAGHGLLRHQTYKSDFELVMMEANAWEEARRLATRFSLIIDEDHIQDCLDSYRDWLHRRSTCPTCGTVSLQRSEGTYACHNCPATWTVTQDRFCRPYRLLKHDSKSEPIQSTPHPTFHAKIQK